jgi:MoxR-vWA-beta-propeller ternary system domain bpX2
MADAWKEARCASIRAEDLPALADLRRHAHLRLAFERDRAWIYWEHASDEMMQILVGRILPLAGVELFTERDGAWYRLGERMPAFDAPPADRSGRMALDQAVLPLPIAGLRPDLTAREWRPLRVVRDESGRFHAATALRCALARVAEWADRATSAQIARLQAAWTGRSDGQHDEPQVLLRGAGQALPVLPESQRFWGDTLLIPLGFRADPDLPETALHRALGSAEGDLAVLDQDGFELIPRNVFRTLDRAAIRLAARGPWAPRDRPERGGPS